MTGSRKEYLLSLENLSNIRHTGKHLSNVIEEVINKVKAKKFVAIVSDNGSNVTAAHKIIANNYPNIINVCTNILIKYFKNSTLGLSWLNEAIKSKNIEGGGLKTYVKTRWTTVYKCVHSVWRLKDALQHVLKNHEHKILNQAIKTILKKRGYFDDVHVISDILKLIKEAILMLERTYTTLADCYLYLLRIATFFKQMPMNDYRSLKNSCIKAFNERYKEFDEDIYLLAFFLHPQYKDEEEEYEEPPNIQKESVDEMLNIEQVIDLGPWVYIESSEIPFMFNNKYDSENDDDWNPEEIV
ncbi:hypothetical protein RhiirA1_479859 [Rhizophagus irregularis]|uniref:Uncharacterized protein n=1 Tax=Rhizophagus irregularis TaxID=588596 RepID=A0A2N0QQ38_9GLOM|nr:hypothetical protein RhiirA1_479859 [Rhizophagus irregularis]